MITVFYNSAKMPPASKRSESGGYNIPQQAVNPISRLVETPDIMASHGEGVWNSCLKHNLQLAENADILIREIS